MLNEEKCRAFLLPPITIGRSSEKQERTELGDFQWTTFLYCAAADMHNSRIRSTQSQFEVSGLHHALCLGHHPLQYCTMDQQVGFLETQQEQTIACKWCDGAGQPSQKPVFCSVHKCDKRLGVWSEVDRLCSLGRSSNMPPSSQHVIVHLWSSISIIEGEVSISCCHSSCPRKTKYYSCHSSTCTLTQRRCIRRCRRCLNENLFQRSRFVFTWQNTVQASSKFHLSGSRNPMWFIPRQSTKTVLRNDTAA